MNKVYGYHYVMLPFIFVPFIISFCFPHAILLPLLYYFVFKCMVGLAKDKNSVYIYNDISGAQQG